MRKLLALFAICLLPPAAHAQQSAGMASRLKPAAFSAPAHDASRYCANCASTDLGASGATRAAAPHAGVSSGCTQRGGPAAGWPFAGASPRERNKGWRFDLSGLGAGRRFRFVSAPEDSPAGLAAVPGLTFSRGGAAFGCAATAFGATAAEPFQSGGGTVNFGSGGYFAFYATSGTAVSQSQRLSEVSGSTLTYSGTGGLDLNGSTSSGQVQLSGATSGTVTLSVKDAAGTYTFKLPDSGGSSGQVLTTDGAGTTSWASPAGSGSALSFDTLTSGAVVTWTFSGAERRKAKLTLGTNATLSLSGVASGSEGDLYVKQDGTGSRTLALPSNSYVSGGGTGVITLSGAANAIDKLHFAYDGTNYYWDATVLNYTSAAAARAVIFNGTSQGGMVTLPTSSPFNSVGGFQILFRIRSSDSSGGPLIKIGGVLEFTDIGSGTYLITDQRDSLSAYHHTGVSAGADRLFRVQYDPSNSRWTVESWSPDGTNYATPTTLSISTTTNFNMGGQTLSVGTNMWGMAFGGAHFDWIRFISRVQALGNSCPSPAPPTGVTWLGDYEFENNLNDSQGVAGNLSPVGSPTYENSPAQTCP